MIGKNLLLTGKKLTLGIIIAKMMGCRDRSSPRWRRSDRTVVDSPLQGSGVTHDFDRSVGKSIAHQLSTHRGVESAAGHSVATLRTQEVASRGNYPVYFQHRINDYQYALTGGRIESIGEGTRQSTDERQRRRRRPGNRYD